jgi:putative ABC transport system permease protein
MLSAPLRSARGAGIALPGSVVAAFAVFGVLFSLWAMMAYRPFGGLDFRRVVLLTQSDAKSDSDSISASNSVLLQDRARSFSAVAQVQFSLLYLRTRNGAQPANLAIVSPEFLNIFKAQIVSGRGLEKRDESWTDGPVGIAVGRGHALPYALTTYDSVGAPVVPVVGVLSERFRGFGFLTSERVDLVLPFPVQAKEREGRNQTRCTALAVLAPGTTIESARREVAAIGAELRREGLVDRTADFRVRPSEALFRPVRQRLAMGTLATAIAFLLVLVCAAGVLQVRAVDRIGEISIRQALGASRHHIVLMLLGENLLLFLWTALAGAAVAAITIQWLGPVLGDGIGLPAAIDPASARWLPFAMVLLAPVLASFVSTAQLAMLIPAFRGGPIAMRSRWTSGRVALRRGLVLSQGATATALAFAAAASIHSLAAIEGRGLGFETTHLLSARVSQPILGRFDADSCARFYGSVVEELKRLPGVRSVGVIAGLPGEKRTPQVQTPVEPLAAAVPTPMLAVMDLVHPSFFREMGIPAIEGRLCDAAQPRDGPPVDVINEAMARRYWPNSDALGKHLRTYGGTTEVVGIVPSLRNSLLEAEPGPEIFVCSPVQRMHLLIRYSGARRPLEGSLLPIVRRLDPDAAVDDIVPVDELLDRSLRPSKVLAGFLSSLGTMAVAVAALGLFAIAAMVIRQRRTELAVRVAVGADPAALGRAIEAEGLGLGAIAIAGGCLLYAVLGRYSVLSGAELDLPWHTAALSAAALLAVMWLAVKWPAYGLRRMDVMAELKQE